MTSTGSPTRSSRSAAATLPGDGLPGELDADAIAWALLSWYDEVRRPLPWREDVDPYRVWVSEVMLQQTQVAKVRPYFARWMERFPTLEALASAPLDEVLSVWSGLGYYSRARNLHAAAQRVVSQHEGTIPRTREALRTLPGIGDYTAGAIASIAFGQQVPLVDTNVARVLSRVAGSREDPRQGAGRRKVWELADALVPARRPGDFNQALMELGSLRCSPRAPACDRCPLRTRCRAHASGLQESIPPKRAASPRHRVLAVALVVRGPEGRVLAVQRAQDGLLGGLWDLPALELSRKERGARKGPRLPAQRLPSGARRRLSAFAAEELGIEPRLGRPLPAVDHIFSHLDYTLFGVQARLARGHTWSDVILGTSRYLTWRALHLDELGELGVPRMTQKLLASLARPSK